MRTENSSYYDELIVCCPIFINFSILFFALKKISILGNMDGDGMEELTDEQLSVLDRMVENLPQNNNSSPIRNESARNGIALKRGRTSSFDGLTDEQLAAIDIEVENASKRFSPSKTRLSESLAAELYEDMAGFDELTATQFNLFDYEVGQLAPRQQHDEQQVPQQHMNGNERTTQTNATIASQIELAAALFDDEGDENGPSIDHLECLISRFKHNRFRDKQWEIIRAVMIEKRDVCAVMATGYGKSLCFQVFIQLLSQL